MNKKRKVGYVFKKLNNSEFTHDNTEVVFKVRESADMTEVLGCFKEFLLASGFIFDPVLHLGLVNDDGELQQ